MDGIWFKRCAQCGNYLKKAAPQESGICCACGWTEYAPPYFCDIIENYCDFCSSEEAKRRIATGPPYLMHV
jgi:hypothetical protein